MGRNPSNILFQTFGNGLASLTINGESRSYKGFWKGLKAVFHMYVGIRKNLPCIVRIARFDKPEVTTLKIGF